MNLGEGSRVDKSKITIPVLEPIFVTLSLYQEPKCSIEGSKETHSVKQYLATVIFVLSGNFDNELA